MKKFARIALTACLLLGIAAQANAVDFKIKGRWISLFDYGQNGNMTGGNGSTGYAKGFDNFEALQRWRIQLDAVASENLSGTVHFEIGKHRWGQASTGGQLGSDSNMVRLKHAYIDWRVPETDLKLRMGIQAINLPGFATDSQVMGSDVAGITASYTFNDNVGLTAFWARAYNDNFLGSDDDAPNNKQNFMDNVDFFGLVLPLTFEGARITPWVMGGMIGPNAFRTQDGYLTNIANCYFVPNLTALNYGFHGNKLTGYGTAFWAGLTGEVTAFDPFRLAWDFNYGSVTYDDGAASRRGWLASVLLEYKLDWGIPVIVGWYASGDDDDLGNGSERLPYTSVDEMGNSFATYAFYGSRPGSDRDCLIGRSMAGTWGVGLRIRDLSFMDKLKHHLRVNLIGGSNDPGILKSIHEKTGVWMSPNNYDGQTIMGMDTMYLTRNDTILECGIKNDYQIYENLKFSLDFSYMALWLDKSDDVWGQSRINGRNDDVRDAWNITAGFTYTF